VRRSTACNVDMTICIHHVDNTQRHSYEHKKDVLIRHQPSNGLPFSDWPTSVGRFDCSSTRRTDTVEARRELCEYVTISAVDYLLEYVLFSCWRASSLRGCLCTRLRGLSRRATALCMEIKGWTDCDHLLEDTQHGMEEILFTTRCVVCRFACCLHHDSS
jgi:hypothetical protein